MIFRNASTHEIQLKRNFAHKKKPILSDWPSNFQMTVSYDLAALMFTFISMLSASIMSFMKCTQATS